MNIQIEKSSDGDRADSVSKKSFNIDAPVFFPTSTSNQTGWESCSSRGADAGSVALKALTTQAQASTVVGGCSYTVIPTSSVAASQGLNANAQEFQPSTGPWASESVSCGGSDVIKGIGSSPMPPDRDWNHRALIAPAPLDSPHVTQYTTTTSTTTARDIIQDEELNVRGKKGFLVLIFCSFGESQSHYTL